MKKNKYNLVFLDNSELIIYADLAIEALYLGIAYKIESGEPYLVDSVFYEQGNKLYVTDKKTINQILIPVN